MDGGVNGERHRAAYKVMVMDRAKLNVGMYHDL